MRFQVPIRDSGSVITVTSTWAKGSVPGSTQTNIPLERISHTGKLMRIDGIVVGPHGFAAQRPTWRSSYGHRPSREPRRSRAEGALCPRQMCVLCQGRRDRLAVGFGLRTEVQDVSGSARGDAPGSSRKASRAAGQHTPYIRRFRYSRLHSARTWVVATGVEHPTVLVEALTSSLHIGECVQIAARPDRGKRVRR